MHLKTKSFQVCLHTEFFNNRTKAKSKNVYGNIDGCDCEISKENFVRFLKQVDISAYVGTALISDDCSSVGKGGRVMGSSD